MTMNKEQTQCYSIQNTGCTTLGTTFVIRARHAAYSVSDVTRKSKKRL